MYPRPFCRGPDLIRGVRGRRVGQRGWEQPGHQSQVMVTCTQRCELGVSPWALQAPEIQAGRPAGRQGCSQTPGKGINPSLSEDSAEMGKIAPNSERMISGGGWGIHGSRR